MWSRLTTLHGARGPPEARSVANAFSDSAGHCSVPSLPQAEPRPSCRGQPDLVADMGLGLTLQRTYRQNYGFDARNSASPRCAANPTRHVELTCTSARQSASAVPGAPRGTVPTCEHAARPRRCSLPALFLAPALTAMTPRAPPLASLLHDHCADFGNDRCQRPTATTCAVAAEQKDPTAALSEPVKSQHLLARPLRCPSATAIGHPRRAGLNVLFERIGFKNAVGRPAAAEKKSQFRPRECVRAIRWMTNADPASSPSAQPTIDPRTGDILERHWPRKVFLRAIDASSGPSC